MEDEPTYQKEQDTEKKILEAAGRIFMIKGKAGASMQDIADEAGINRTLLHYYFRSKDKLFDAIFNDLLGTMFPVVAGIFMSDMPLIRKFEFFAEKYVDLLKEKPFLPFFIFQEVLLNPERLVGLVQEGGLNASVAMAYMKDELKKIGITDMDPRHLIANIIGMVIFPFVGRPVFERLAFQGDKEAYDAFLDERKKEVPRFVRMALSVTRDP